MNPAIVILISALTVTTGIVVYDSVRDEPVAVEHGNDVYEPALTVEEADEYEPEPGLSGAGFESLMARVDKLERENDSLKALLAKRHGSTVNADGSISADAEALAAFTLPAAAEGDEPVFEEDFLKAFRAALEKVETDRRQERVLDGLNRQLDRLGVELSDDQRKSVVDSTVAFREKSRDTWRNLPRGTDDESRENRRSQLEAIRDEYSTTIYSLVPAAEAETIVNGMGRGIGFSGRGRGDGGSAMVGGRRGNR